MAPVGDDQAEDHLILRFVGVDEEGHDLHELRAAHVAEVLEGLVGLHSDFDKAGAFGEGPPSDVLVRPAREGSFIIEVVRFVTEHLGEEGGVAAAATALGVPSLGSIIWWATRSLRADVEDVDHLANGNVKIKWQDKTVSEVPRAAWDELSKRDRRRKKQLRQIMAPLSDEDVTALQVSDPGGPVETDATETEDTAPSQFTLERTDYNLARPEDEIEEVHRIFTTEAQMAAIDFDSPERWRVKTRSESRAATVEDGDFLGRLDRGFALRKTDIFNLRIREDRVTKNGRTSTTWTVLQVVGYRRTQGDGDDA